MKYGTILLDPPWDYNQKLASHDTTRGGAIKHYDLMTLDEIRNLPIIDLANKDCILWLWVTNSFIQEGLELVDYWGFTYKTMITWAKTHFGIGYWLRGQTEHLLLAVKGNPRHHFKGIHGACGNNHSTLLTAKRREHSRKPVKIYSIIEDISPPPRLELFARTRRQGWDVWGNEVPNETQVLLSQNRIISVKRENSEFSPNPKSEILDFV